MWRDKGSLATPQVSRMTLTGPNERCAYRGDIVCATRAWRGGYLGTTPAHNALTCTYLRRSVVDKKYLFGHAVQVSEIRQVRSVARTVARTTDKQRIPLHSKGIRSWAVLGSNQIRHKSLTCSLAI